MMDKDKANPYAELGSARFIQTRRRSRGPWYSRSAFAFVLVLCTLHFSGVTNVLVDLALKDKHKPLVGREAEKAFLSVPDETSAILASRQFATKPHLAGSPQDLQTAKDFLAVLQRELGIKPPRAEPIFAAGSPASRHATESISRLRRPTAWIDTYFPVMNTPLERELVVVAENGTVVWEADLVEEADATDPEAHLYADEVPTFHGLSPEGIVQGKLVYANYGDQDDYNALVKQGVDLTGALVICRYGGIFRGLKVKGAQELGASGVLIYSDPRDDGTVTVANGYEAYPHGPARSPTSVQRGSVQYLSIYPGDPTTPGYPSYENSTRTEGSNIPKIPSLPISWANAQVLLEKVGKGGEWEGVEVKLVNKVDQKVTPIWNTIGVIPGFIKDEVVMLGNHRDAWVMGATDPSSGTASVHEVIRGFGSLIRQGWKPLRTIIIASWDAEEYGLIGSTEYGEDFATWLGANVVAYLNLDSSVSGSRFSTSASPLLAHLLKQTAEELPHPTEPGRSLWSASQDTGKLFGKNATLNVDSHDDQQVASSTSIGVNPLGSGSDYTVFLQWIGIPCSNGGFSSTLHDPVYHYHSVFDSERWQELYGDAGFFRHVAIAKHLGLQTLRISSSIVLPFNTTYYADQLSSYLDGVEHIATLQSINLDVSPLRTSLEKLRVASISLDFEKLAAEESFKTSLKKFLKWRSRRTIKKTICRILKRLGLECSSGGHHGQTHDSRSLNDDLGFQELVGFAYHSGFQGCFGRLNASPIRDLQAAAKRVHAVNQKLRKFELGFISKEGIKDREWYKHLGVAPGKWLGYGATTLPALTESLTFEKNLTLATYEVGRLVSLVDNLVDTIRV